MILLVGNYESDVGYAWHLIERLWCEIARRNPGRVAVSFVKVRKVSPELLASGARIMEHEFRLDSPETWDFLRKHDFRHVYLSDRPIVSRWYPKLRAAGVETITVHDHIYVDQPPPGIIRGALKWVMARLPGWSADALLSVSPLMHQRHVHTLKMPPHKCHLATNGIDLTGLPAPHDIRTELGIPPDVAIAVSCGRAHRQKGVHTIIEASKLLKEVAFVHIGDGPMLQEYRAQGTRVHFLGHRTDVSAILAGADFAVHASSSEGLSLAILEFMRAGLPVLVPNIPSVSQTIEHDVAGLHYKAGDPVELAKMASALVKDAERRARLSIGSRAAILRYDIKDTIAAVGRVVQWVTRRSDLTEDAAYLSASAEDQAATPETRSGV